ncbi:hypothetical protein CHGG_08622 [Chaetomium globosum CBS 148.51]|uniref:Glucose-methanol-choline oxidoreductase N-terminal domain-containing protein n=1 Tax=Chaetomium globosum (strain ATCC 6205 / CBS 148.51 / DSM 1962 / NBRC 6347 / NRRL 1970) TaxID=306901 RepID=Q2GTT2_CHAGB|nr:uncharacterized protein CHGG_08622 [Chaetomium globosum CBS 148.51]EAQ84608.1 hypothetical protein CHGG_08622 [Chaetomium globosum CBS 148.51]
MKFSRRIGATALAASLSLQQCAAQMTAGTYTDEKTGITFNTWEATSGAAFTFGMALPADALTTDATEYIGLLRCAVADASAPGYCAISHGQSGQMSQALLLVAYASEGTVYTSFRYATGYTLPPLYTGDAKLTQISSTVSDTGFEVLFRCENCFAWDQDGATGSVSTTAGNLVLGRAAAKTGLEGASCPDTATFGFHDNGFGQWGAALEGAPSESYEEWAALATTTPETTCDGSGGPIAECKAAPETTYDYIVVGGGAGGIPVADKLSEAGHKVLLIEKGPPSTGRWKGTMKPDWLEGTDLTRFDVPGLCNQIWVDSAGIACTDTDQMAGCVLGGGTAVNAGLWWKPNHLDWDENFPNGWHSSDVSAATERVFSRIPGTWHPSVDGELYRQEGFEVLSGGLAESGWTSVVANDEPNSKNHTFAHSHFMFAGGERDGPLATYLVSADGRDNFDLWTNTAVRRAVRSGSKVTGVELECLTDGGYSGTIKLNEKGGVIFSAGAFGSAKLLLRSDTNTSPPRRHDPQPVPRPWCRLARPHDHHRKAWPRSSRSTPTCTTTRISKAVIQGIKNVQNALNVIPNITWVLPPPEGSVEDYVNGLAVGPSNRRANHWMGTAKLGSDDGRNGGTAVVDLDTKVYGTDNLFVVDASIFPGMSTGNPSAMIVIVAEQAAQRILAVRS